jgi:hypothetical protein
MGNGSKNGLTDPKVLRPRSPEAMPSLLQPGSSASHAALHARGNPASEAITNIESGACVSKSSTPASGTTAGKRAVEMPQDSPRILVHGCTVSPKAGALPGCATPRPESSLQLSGSRASLELVKLTLLLTLAGTPHQDPQAAALSPSAHGANFTAQEAAAPSFTKEAD